MYLLVVEQHVVDVLDGLLGGLVGLEVDEAVAAAVGVLVGHDLAGEDVAEGGEGVVEGLVVDALVQVLDEDVAHAGLAERRVALRPHDAHGLLAQVVEVHNPSGYFFSAFILLGWRICVRYSGGSRRSFVAMAHSTDRGGRHFVAQLKESERLAQDRILPSTPLYLVILYRA